MFENIAIQIDNITIVQFVWCLFVYNGIKTIAIEIGLKFRAFRFFMIKHQAKGLANTVRKCDVDDMKALAKIHNIKTSFEG